MTRRSMTAIAACVAGAMVCFAAVRPAAQSPPPQSQIPRTPDGKPDLNGIWQAMNTANYDLEDHGAGPSPVLVTGAIGAILPGESVVEGGRIPYRPEALAQRNENRRNSAPGKPGRNLEADPELNCFLPGVPRATYLPHPFQIFQSPKVIWIVYQYSYARREVPLDNPTEAPYESWMGWSNGRWEGDTLVVDVTGFNGQTWFDRAGNYHSDALHVIERYTPISAYHLLYEAMIEDPKVFTRPWKISMPLYRRIDRNVRLLEFKCPELVEELHLGEYRKVTPSK
ncbi:MAG: hypothetical protein HYY76_00320 [Acidobacteria bacterium]|nr:hypothetical protein [Acidobacteriota bacterium]